MKKLLLIITLLSSSALLATPTFFQNAELDCGAVMETNYQNSDAPFMVKIISDNESISYDGRPIVEAYEVGGVIDELELAITEKQTIELKLEEPSYETFELYQTKRGWFGTRKVKTFCKGMVRVSEDEFIF